MQHVRILLLLGGMAANLVGQAGMGTPTAGGQTGVQGSTNTGMGGGTRGPDTARPIYISGRVIIEDGSVLPENITIQRVCSGIAKPVAYTDSRGRFNFQWNDQNLVMTDAADAGSGPARGGFGGAQSAGASNALATDPFGNRMMNCELRASVAGFSSSTVNLFNRRSGDNPDVGTLVLHRIAGVSGSSISVTSMKAPKDAKKVYEHGLEAMLKNKPADAAKDFEKAVSLYPTYADAWVSLGKLRLDQQSMEPARTALKKAMESDPQLVAPYLELGLLAAKDANWAESGKFLDRALELDPVDYPQAWYADAVANFNLKKCDAAEKSARTAVKLDPQHVNPRADYLLGLVLAEKKDYAGAAAELTAFVKLAPNAPDLAQVKDELGRFEKLASTSK